MNKLIGNFIQINARVLDLGCGDGSLLAFLKKNNQVKGLGLEIDSPHGHDAFLMPSETYDSAIETFLEKNE